MNGFTHAWKRNLTARLTRIVGSLAPAFVSADLSGKAARLADLKGRVVVLAVWATWCGPSRATISPCRDLAKKMTGQPFALSVGHRGCLKRGPHAP